MVVLLSMPRGRISAARMAARRDEVEEAYGVLVRSARMDAPAAEPARPDGLQSTMGGEA